MAVATRKTTGSAPYKHGMRALVGAVSIVAAHGRDGAPVGMTATSVTSLSADPPSLLVCVNRGSTIAGALVADAHFSANVLAADQIDVAKAFAGAGGLRGAGRFIHGDWFRSGDEDVPLLSGCKVAFECVVAHVHDWATHHIVIGAVTEVHFLRHGVQALAYVDGGYHAVG